MKILELSINACPASPMNCSLGSFKEMFCTEDVISEIYNVFEVWLKSTCTVCSAEMDCCLYEVEVHPHIIKSNKPV